VSLFDLVLNLYNIPLTHLSSRHFGMHYTNSGSKTLAGLIAKQAEAEGTMPLKVFHQLRARRQTLQDELPHVLKPSSVESC
jgi:hypothetical protein